MCKIKSYIAIFLVSLLVASCKEEMPGTLSKTKNVPNSITDVQVENLHGGAKLKYTLPSNEDLLYIKAVYESPKGNQREVKASMYTDSLIIDGIGSTEELEVQLYAVNRSEVSSSPVTVKINPLTPPVQLVGVSLALREDFGGVIANFENETEANVVISILRKDGEEWTSIETYYTNKRSGFFNARGQKSAPQEFGVFAKDRWGNKSDTLTVVLSPLYEERLPSPVPITTLYNDYNKHFSVFTYSYLFDGIYNIDNYAGTLLNSPASALPQSFTIDFKKPTNFSRFKYFMRMYTTGTATGYYYNNGNPEKWEIWGTNTLDPEWNKWTKIMDCVAVKPSGLPVGQVTQTDRDVALAGLDFNFPANTPPYRYLRWKTTKNFGTVDYVQMSELMFWGSQQ